MKRHELIDVNPLRLISPAKGGMVSGRHLGLVKAPAGTGKTAILVQIALDKLLRGERVVHVGINDHIDNIKDWYRQVFLSLARRASFLHPLKVEGEIMVHRLLMTFMADNFTPSRLVKRLDDLSAHGISLPDCLLVDGLDTLQDQGAEMYGELRRFAEERNISIWISSVDSTNEAEAQVDTLLELKTSHEGQSSLKVVKDGVGYAESGAAMLMDSQTLTLCR